MTCNYDLLDISFMSVIPCAQKSIDISTKGARMAKKLRTIKLTDETWEALRVYAEAKGLDRTKVVESLAVAYIPQRYWPIGQPDESQRSIFDELDLES